MCIKEMRGLELAEKTVFTLLDLGCSNITWSEAATYRLSKLRDLTGQAPKGFISHRARFLVIFGEFTAEQVKKALKAEKGLAPYFTVKVITGKTALDQYITSQPPEGAMEVTPGMSGEQVLGAIAAHGG